MPEAFVAEPPCAVCDHRQHTSNSSPPVLVPQAGRVGHQRSATPTTPRDSATEPARSRPAADINACSSKAFSSSSNR